MRLGVMGGTFDPVHYGHLVAAQEAIFRFTLDNVVFIPSARPPHKVGRSISTIELRLRMVGLAIRGNPGLSVSPMEMERDGLSYTIDSLRELRSEYGTETELFLIMGADELLEMDTWKDPADVLAESRVIVATRRGYSLEGIKDALPECTRTGNPATDRVQTMEIPTIDVSSTMIRARIAAGEPFRYMVPEAVWSFILEEGLYLQR